MPAPRSTYIPLYKRAISDNGFHLQLKAAVNGISCFLTLDTGASDTVFDTLTIEQMLGRKSRLIEDRLSAGLGTTEMESRHIRIRELRLGRLCIPSLQFTCLDLQHLNLSYRSLGIQEVAGVLGSDILTHFSAGIDYRSNRLILRAPEENRSVFAKKAYFVV